MSTTFLPPVRVNYRHLAGSAALTTRIESEVAALTRLCREIFACVVTIELPRRQPRAGRSFRVGVEVILPGRPLVIEHRPPVRAAARGTGRGGPTADAYVAIRGAFKLARRRLEERAARRRQSRRRS